MDWSVPISELQGVEFFLTEFDIKEKVELFKKDPKKFLAFAPIRYILPDGEKASCTGLNVFFSGHITTHGIFKSRMFGDQPPTLGLSFDSSPSGADVFFHLETELALTLPGYKVTSVLKNGGVYLKLKTKKDADEFDFDCDIPISPSLIKEAGLVKDQAINVAVEVFTYYNVKDKTCGLVLKLLEITTITPNPEVDHCVLPITPPPNTPITISNAPGTFFGSRPNTPPPMKRRKSMVPKRLDFSQRN